LSIEYWAVEAYAGKDPRAVNPILVRLLRDLSPSGNTVLRVGGVSTDETWWPVAGFRRPPGVNYSLNARRLEVLRALADAVGARLLMGLNLEAGSPTLAAAEAQAMVAALGSRRIVAFELGNEPELFGNRAFGWYVRDHRRIVSRPRTYDMAAFTRDFSSIGSELPLGRLAGPASGGYRWLAQLGSFAAAEPALRMMTVHRYPLQACYNAPGSPTYPTMATLLSPYASTGYADGVAPYVTVAHSRHLPLRIDEMNNISCGVPAGIPNTFAMALWILDALFADVRVGVDGVNIHTYPTAVYQLFKFTHANSSWRARIEPEYYGLLAFAQAAPPGARLLPTSGGTRRVRAWATRDPHGSIRVVLINDDIARAHRVAVRVSGAHGSATLARLLAPSAQATDGVTLSGQSFAPSTETGKLSGRRTITRVNVTDGNYVVRLPAASAALLTLHAAPSK
jgi:hypothetical protein